VEVGAAEPMPTPRHQPKQIMRIFKADQELSDFSSDINPTSAAAVVIDSLMKSLVGSLSPLTAEFDALGEHGPEAAYDLASQIAKVFCVAVLPYTRVTPITDATRRQN